jgi:hypothetical protein
MHLHTVHCEGLVIGHLGWLMVVGATNSRTDVMVVKIWTTDEQLLLFRVYISPVEFYQAEDDGSIQYTLHEIHQLPNLESR